MTLIAQSQKKWHPRITLTRLGNTVLTALYDVPDVSTWLQSQETTGHTEAIRNDFRDCVY